MSAPGRRAMGAASPDSGGGASGPKVLLVLGHGREESLCHHLLRLLRESLLETGAEVRVEDLLADGFDPVLRLPAGVRHALPEHCTTLARRYQGDVLWMDSLVVIHPVWWFAPPAILKGWVDQVLVHGIGIEQPPAGPPQPRLQGRRALLIQTFNAPASVDRFFMRGLAGLFWKRAVFLSAGIAEVERLAFYEVEGLGAKALERIERRVRRAALRIASP